MRIPVYKSEIRATSDAPGRRFSVRKDATPYIRAELAKGEIAEALLGAASDFAGQRIKMINEKQYNDAALRIEEEMRQASYDLQKDTDFDNILDGENKWGQRMDAIRDDILPTVSSKAMRKKLGYEFEANEIQYRFQLRGAIDKRIIAAEQASLKTRTEGIVAYLSSSDRTKEEFNTEMGKLVRAYEPGLKNGRFNPEATTKLFNQVIKDVGANIVDGYVGSTPTRAVELQIALQQAHDMDHGVVITDEERAQLYPGGEYVMHVLRNMDMDDALDVIEESLRSATLFQNAYEKLEEQQIKDMNFVFDNIKNRYQYYANVTEQNTIEASDLSETDKAVPEIANFFENFPEGTMQRSEVISHIKNYLYQNNQVDEATQNAFDRDEERSTAPFTSISKPEVYKMLFDDIIADDASLSYIDSYTTSLSKADYKELVKMFNEREAKKLREEAGYQSAEQAAITKAIKLAEDTAKFKFKFQEQKSDDPVLENASRAGYNHVMLKITELERDAQILTPTEFKAKYGEEKITPTLINDQTQKFIQEQAGALQVILQQDYNSYIQLSNDLIGTNGLKEQGLYLPGYEMFNNKTPLQVLDEWWGSDTTEQTPANLRKYRNVRARLVEFQRQGLFE